MDRPIYRIIDANFNRAREAARAIEEYCRFALNCEPLTARAKQLRHELCTSIAKLDPAKLIAARDTTGDIGVGQKIENQLARKDLTDFLTAACKRLVEALRVLAELTQTIDPAIHQTIESLRYSAYTLEKDIFIFADTTKKFENVRLYVLISSSLPAEIITLTQKCAIGQADCIQLRAKDMEADSFFATAREFVKICKDSNVISIINDRSDIAIAADADGVHLGQNDLPIAQARKLQLKPMIIGISTHSIEQLKTAIEQSPTYVGLGPVFETNTKSIDKPAGLDYISDAVKILADTNISHVAIGGINLDNIDEVLKAGAKNVAISSAITQSQEPTETCKKIKQKLLS